MAQFPQVDTWVHRAPSAGNIGMINTRATARFAQSHLPQGKGIQDRQWFNLPVSTAGSPSGLTSVKVILHPTGNYRKHTESGEPVSVPRLSLTLKKLEL